MTGLGLAKWHEKVNFRREINSDTNRSVKAVVRFLTRCQLPPQHAGVIEAELSGEISKGRSVMMSSRAEMRSDDGGCDNRAMCDWPGKGFVAE